LSNIERNCKDNLTIDILQHVQVEPQKWGELTDEFSKNNKHGFDRVLAADCFWMRDQHENLVSSMLHFLSVQPTARVLMIGGFHTGRSCMSRFLSVAKDHGLNVDTVHERDVDGNERPWMSDRGIEDVVERKRWLVVAILCR
jgi:nicotinamide N-methyltransferase